MDTIFYRLRTNKTLFSFGDDIRSVPICGKSLSERQVEAIEQNGGKVVDIASEKEIKEKQYFIFEDDLLFTKEFVKQLILSIQKDAGSKQYGLAENEFNNRYILPHSQDSQQNLRFAFYFINRDLTTINLCEIRQKLFDNELFLPNQIVKGSRYYVGRSDCFIGRIASPFHLLQLNLAFNLMRTIPIQGFFPEWMVKKFGNPGSRFYYMALKRMNKIGKNCQIHPSAIIEASVLGDHVIVGANSVIRFSQIENGSVISDNVALVNCVLGENNVIANSNYLSFNLLFNNVFLIHGPYQFSVFGMHSAAFAVINCDIRLDQENIKIPTDVGVLGSNQPLLGIAYGHYSKTGGGNIIAAGRIVPNHKIINPPENIILKF
jgi:NDP-sugar pyrophosphorylase family protein